MTPQARVQAAVEILDAVIVAARGGGAPADRVVADWFKARRFAGSGDRRAVRELVFAAIRACGPIPNSGRAAMLRLAEDDPNLAALFDGSKHAPLPIAGQEPAASGGIAPRWLEERLTASGIDLEDARAMLLRAPLDVRINTLKASLAELPEPGMTTQAPHARRYAPGTAVERWEAYAAGAIEVQDTGSQLAALALGAQPGEAIVDLCAGAGGKALALAADMDDRGTLLACDSDRARLAKLLPRAARAGVTIAETRLLDPGREEEALTDWVGRADAVLVDAPCSGSGTWRRNPEARWRLTPGALARVVDVQARLLDLAATLVRPGGRLVPVVCSVLDEEGADQVARFIARHPGWAAQPLVLGAGLARGHGLRLTPQQDGCDGFFIASLTRT